MLADHDGGAPEDAPSAFFIGPMRLAESLANGGGDLDDRARQHDGGQSHADHHPGHGVRDIPAQIQPLQRVEDAEDDGDADEGGSEERGHAGLIGTGGWRNPAVGRTI